MAAVSVSMRSIFDSGKEAALVLRRSTPRRVVLMMVFLLALIMVVSWCDNDLFTGIDNGHFTGIDYGLFTGLDDGLFTGIDNGLFSGIGNGLFPGIENGQYQWSTWPLVNQYQCSIPIPVVSTNTSGQHQYQLSVPTGLLLLGRKHSSGKCWALSVLTGFFFLLVRKPCWY